MKLVTVYSNAGAVNISWKKADSNDTISINDSRYEQVLEPVTVELPVHAMTVPAAGVQVTLIIHNCTASDFGSYILEIKNGQGVVFHSFVVMINSMD